MRNLPFKGIAHVSLHPTLLYTLAMAIPALGQFLLLPVYGWYLGPEEFGRLSLIQAAIFIFQVLTANTLASALARYWHTRSDINNLLTTSLLICSGLTFLWTVLACFISPDIIPGYNLQSTPVLIIASGIAGLLSLEAIYMSPLIQNKKPRQYLNRIALHISLSVIGTWVFIQIFEASHLSAISGRLAGMILGIVPFAIKDASGGKFDFKIIRLLMKFILPIIPYLAISQLLLASDRWLLGEYSGETYTGIFTAVLGLAAISEMIFQALRNNYQPEIYAAWTMRKAEVIPEISGTFLKYGLSAHVIIFPLSALAIYVLFPESFKEGLSVLPWLSAAFIFRLLFILDSLPEFYLPRAWPLPLSAGIGLCAFLFSGYFLINTMGWTGTGPAFLISRISISVSIRIFSRNTFVRMKYRYPLEFFIIMAITLGLGIGFILYPELPFYYIFIVSIPMILLSAKPFIIKKRKEE